MTKQPNDQQQQGQQGQNRQQGQAGKQGQQGMAGKSQSARQQQQFETAADERITTKIRENMSVIGCDGARIGKVDSVEGNRIKLTRADWPNDGSPGASHHYLELGQVQSIEDNAVRLSITAEQAEQQATHA